MRLTKRQLKVIGAFVVSVILITTGFYIYKASQKKYILDQCNNFINLYEYTMFPEEYRKIENPVPDSVVEEMKNKIREDYKNLFTKEQYKRMLEKDFTYIDRGVSKKGWRLDSYCEILSTKQYKLYGNNASIQIEVYQKGNDYSVIENQLKINPYESILLYVIEFEKTNGKWLISSMNPLY